jgi:hypothetical protein
LIPYSDEEDDDVEEGFSVVRNNDEIVPETEVQEVVTKMEVEQFAPKTKVQQIVAETDRGAANWCRGRQCSTYMHSFFRIRID